MDVVVRKLTPEEVRGVTVANMDLAPVHGRLAAYAGESGGMLMGEVRGERAAVAAFVVAGETLQVEQFAVSPRFRGHGLGGKLIRAVVEEARARGLKKVRAEAMGWCPEWRAFYTRHGFVYLEGGSDTDMVPVELTLSSNP